MSQLQEGQQIRLKGDEYSSIIADIAEDYFNRIISDDKVFVPLSLNDEDKLKFSIELISCLIIIALRTFDRKILMYRVKSVIRTELSKQLGSKLFNLTDKDLDSFIDIVNKKYKAFEKMLPSKKTSQQIANNSIQKEIGGFARYLISTTTGKDENEVKEIIKNCTKYFFEYSEIIYQLVNNTIVDSTSILMGKVELLVTKGH